MARPSAALLLFAGFLAVSLASARAAAPMLTQGDMADPDAVVAWLKVNGSKADKAIAERAYELGRQKKQRKDWGAAAKAFGDSVAFYPTPKALTEMAEAQLRLLRELRMRDQKLGENWKRDLGAAWAIYRTALAADTVLQTLDALEKERLRQKVECLSRHIELEIRPPACIPLDLYGR